jgi:hypothetical protein
MPTILLWWPMTTKVDFGGMPLEYGLFRQYLLDLVSVQQVTAEGQFDKMGPVMEVLKQSCVIRFLHPDKFAPIDRRLSTRTERLRRLSNG